MNGPDLWSRVHTAAREEGLAPALALLCAPQGPAGPPYGPRGHAVLPGTDVAPLPDGATVLDTVPLPGGSVTLLRLRDGAADPPPPAPEGFTQGLAWLRLGLSQWLCRQVMAYLATRNVGGAPLLRQQLVKGAIADTVGEHLELRETLEAAGADPLDAGTLGDLHRQLTVTDRAQVRLLGARGYLAEGPGHAAYLSELLAEAYLNETGPSGRVD
ncbi:hypothetical protein ACIQGZ_20870 [Streptomyces sp. NPDC092296]|uniref:hypothetical protein n=1 Tax=Streptomyces sp. NPDC092296 TaxID=3366012 RepID=UPI0038146DFB